MDLLKTAAAAVGIDLSSSQIDMFRRYYEELVDWNTRVNLTSVTAWKAVQTKHFLDSLSVSLAIPRDWLESGRFVDVGTGAGFPGMPLKIAFPDLEASLIDSTAKKTAFLTHLAGTLGLAGVEVCTGRAETLAHQPTMREGFDFALTRAVAGIGVLAELTLPFCRTGGIVVVQKGPDIDEEIAGAHKAIETMGGRIMEVREVGVPELGDGKRLVVLEKVGPTPQMYPRRAGVPAKRPL